MSNIDDLLRTDLAGLVNEINRHGSESEKVRQYVSARLERYKTEEDRKEYLKLSASVIDIVSNIKI